MDLVAKICRVWAFWRLRIAGGRCHVLVEEDWSLDEAIVCGITQKAAQNGRSRGLARLEAIRPILLRPSL
jgi:hypothetical protein